MKDLPAAWRDTATAEIRNRWIAPALESAAVQHRGLLFVTAMSEEVDDRRAAVESTLGEVTDADAAVRERLGVAEVERETALDRANDVRIMCADLRRRVDEVMEILGQAGAECGEAVGAVTVASQIRREHGDWPGPALDLVGQASEMLGFETGSRVADVTGWAFESGKLDQAVDAVAGRFARLPRFSHWSVGEALNEVAYRAKRGR